MIRLFPKFWKLNSNSCHWTKVLTGSRSEIHCGGKLTVSVASMPWIVLISQISGYPYHALPRANLEKDLKCVQYRYEAAQCFGWIRTRNYEMWVLNLILPYIFLGPITACASDYPLTYVYHCETDCVHGMMSFVPLFGAETQSFETSTTHHHNSLVILGLIFDVVF